MQEAVMPTYRTSVGSNGQISLPLDLIDRLGIREGAEVEFFLTLEGDVFFHAITGVATGGKGLFPTERRSPPLSIKEMDEGIAEAISEDYERIRRQDSAGGSEGKTSPEIGKSAAE
jgi:bifunctional DNA-binding transcriptional regulator/antitoxin component of YhaV-PrlF toxin-antitoxin module